MGYPSRAAEIDILKTGHWNHNFINNGVNEIRDYSYLNQDKCIHEFCQRILNSLFDIYVYPLCRLYAFRLSDNVTEIVLASCHLVSDGLGNQQILRDFVSLYRAYLKKNSLDYGISFLEYKQAVEESLDWVPDGEIKPQPAKHWRRKMKMQILLEILIPRYSIFQKVI